ncbi:MAG: ABC transporter substrate-binding protein [bacterium]|nr:ABC transporter substrate-binding protein [bacterium]
MQKNRFVRAFLLAATFALLTVVPFVATAQDEIVVDLYFPTAVDGPIVETIQGYAEQFEAANPGITVNAVYTGDYNGTREAIQAETASGELIVDVAVMLATDLFSFIEEGYIVPVQPYIDALEDPAAFEADFFPAFLANSRDAEGTLWSIPFQRSTPVLYYNVEMLEAAGVEVPTNNEELLAAAEALSTDTVEGFLLPVAGVFPTWLVQSFQAAYGQPVVGDNPGEVFFNTDATLAALQYIDTLKTTLGEEVVSEWGETPAAFIAGEAAMIYHTTGSLSNILNNAPFEVGVAFLASGPAGEDGTGYGAPTGGGNLYIFDDGSKSPEELDAAWRLVEFLSSPEIQSDWGVASGYVAARISAWDIEPLLSRSAEFPQYAVARDQLEFAVKEFSAYRTVDIQNIINTTLARIISGEVSIDEAPALLEEAQGQIDELLAEYAGQ